MKIRELHRLVMLLQSQSNSTVDMCLTKLDLFAAIAHLSGLAAADYAEMVGLPESSTTRHIREMRDGKSGIGRPIVGLGLVEARPTKDDWRKHEIYLTRKGKLLLEQLLALGGDQRKEE